MAGEDKYDGGEYYIRWMDDMVCINNDDDARAEQLLLVLVCVSISFWICGGEEGHFIDKKVVCGVL